MTLIWKSKKKFLIPQGINPAGCIYAYASGGVGVSPAADVYDKQCIIWQFLVIESVQILMIFLTPTQELLRAVRNVFSGAKVAYLFENQ